MPETHHVYLIPGFFGFADIGGITYFHHVHQLIEQRFDEAGVPVEVHEVATLPTASIRKRAGRVYETVNQTASGSGPVHLIGHSTGGLDARLFVTPNANLIVAPEADVESAASRVKTVVTVATPHFGTPMATFFSSVLGAQLLRVISLATIYTMQFGKLPLAALMAVGKVVTKYDDLFGLKNSVLDQLYDNLFGDFDEDRQEEIRSFLNEVQGDRALVGQLTPGGIDLLNAATEDRGGVRYGSVAMMAREPGLSAMKSIGFDPYRQASHLLYRLLHRIVGDEDAYYPTLLTEQRQTMVQAYGEAPGPTRSDGIVPTLSQVWGELFYAGHGDHLDVCGHFNDVEHDPPHFDWIATGTSFSRPQFEALWTAVTDYLFGDT